MTELREDRGGATAADGERSGPSLCLEGEYWTIVYAGATLRLRDAVGMHYLAHLLAHPDETLPVDSLLAAVRGRVASDSGQARSSVTKRIRTAIAKIARHHPALAYHLSTAVRTGYACAYRPGPDRPPQWTLSVPGLATEGVPAPNEAPQPPPKR